MNRTLTTSAVLASLLVGACATSQPPPTELIDARTTMREAELDANVLTHAPLELKKATDSLARANQLQDKGEPVAEIRSAAYVADQQAKTAMAMALAKGNDIAIASAEVDRERARADMLAGQAQSAQAAAQTAQARSSLAQQQAANAEQRASGAEAQAANARGQADQLAAQLAALQATQTERGMLVTLGDVLFEFNRADVKPGAQLSLQKLATFLQEHPDRRILIEGHTDSIGSASANNKLSQRRAEAVDAALVGMGLAPQRVTTVGYGEEFPIADNATDTNRALNRRVEVYIAESGQPVAPRR